MGEGEQIWPPNPRSFAAAPASAPQRSLSVPPAFAIAPLLLYLLLLQFLLPCAAWAWSISTEPFLCASSCRCVFQGREVSAQCGDGVLTEVPADLPMGLVSLDARGNSIADLFVGQAWPERLSHLDLSSNALTTLSSDGLANLSRLDTADFSSNAIDTIEAGAFQALVALRVLRLAENQISGLSSEMLQGLSSLQVLNLSGNVISEIGNQSFLYLHCLKILDLSNNRLEILPANAFLGLETVQTILLHHNSLVSITGAFFNLLQLQALDLSNNGLMALTNDTFSTLPGLNSLQLSFNNISEISPQFASHSDSLRTLHLRGNLLEQLDSNIFASFPMLQDLDVSQMPYLRSVSYDTLHGASSLSFLNLSHNPLLSFLHPQLFSTSPQLTVIDLRSNNISVLSHVTFLTNRHLSHLYLAGNPLLCGCELGWLIDPTSLTNVSVLADLDQVLCQLPSNGSAVRLWRLSEDSVQCSNVSLVNVTDSMAARIGSQLLLRCDHWADSTGALTWVTPRGRTFHYHPFHPDATLHLLDEASVRYLDAGFHDSHPWHQERSYDATLQENADHVVMLDDGSLYVDFVLRTDAGPYRCIVHNWQHQQSATINVLLDYSILFQVKNMSIVAGLGCAATFFTLNAVYVIIMWIARKLVNKRRRERIHHLLESLDDYRTTQINRIRTNYSSQLGRIRDHYHAQSMRLKEHYSTQMKRVKRGCSNQVERIRDNYHAHLAHLKDYSSHQIHQIREATNNQIIRLRDYGSLQIDRLRETYKLQQQHVLKVIEAMNLENCRTVVETECMRTESMMLDIHFPDLDDDNTSSEEVSSQHSHADSVYATALNSADHSSAESLATVVPGSQQPELPADCLTLEVPPALLAGNMADWQGDPLGHCSLLPAAELVGAEGEKEGEDDRGSPAACLIDSGVRETII